MMVVEWTSVNTCGWGLPRLGLRRFNLAEIIKMASISYHMGFWPAVPEKE
jgi:hypothetical protein